MLTFLKRKLESLLSAAPAASVSASVTGQIERDLGFIREICGDDLKVRRILLPGTRRRCALAYLDGLNTAEVIGETVLRPMLNSEAVLARGKTARDSVEILAEAVLQIADLSYTSDLSSLKASILRGECALLVDGADVALSLGTASPPARGIEEPNTERVVRGPRDGFTEVMKTNVALIRQRLRDGNLVLETLTVGERSNTQVGILYLRNLTDGQLVGQVRKRLALIRIDGVLESGYIEQMIEDNHWSVFAQVGNTERPDVVAAKLLEGRVAIVVDCTPVVLTVPFLFIEGLQTSEDYYSRPWYSSISRLVRFIALFFSIAAPGLYTALVSYHQELIPTRLLVSMAAASEGTPFPTYLEVLVMGLIFEILREASIRLPRNVGQTVSIVGTLVIGQAAIQAGLFGAPIIIVVAITALASFVPTPLADAATILRLLMALAAGVSGLYGMLILSLVLLGHLCSLESFGVPYLSPIAPFSASGQLDTLVRAPWQTMRQRPAALHPEDQRRLRTPHREEGGAK